MRWVIRFGLAALWGIVATLLMLTTETAADEMGYVSGVRAVVRQGWRAMVDAGYADWLVRLFWLLSGFVVAVWGEYGLRKIEARRATDFKAHATFGIEAGFAFGSAVSGIDGMEWCAGTHIAPNRLSDPEVSDHVLGFTLVFDREVREPYVIVISDKKAIWRLAARTSRFIVVEVDLRDDAKAKLEIVVRPSDWPKLGKASQEMLVWADTW
jgi:hypothetical protein